MPDRDHPGLIAAIRSIQERSAREGVLFRLAAAHDRFAELEQLARGRGDHAAAEVHHHHAWLVLRAYEAESRPPEVDK
jgi:hypothetical protein